MKAVSSRPVLQRGGFIIGFVIGLLIGLAIALGVALYVTKAPNPFVNKVVARPAGQDASEVERNRNWDPNTALAGRNPASAALAASATASSPAAATGILPPVATAPLDARAADASSSLAPPVPRERPARPWRPRAASATAPPLSSVAAVDPFIYFVQAGAFARNEDAEQQRAKLAIMGIESKLTEREQGGRTVFRVRVGPFEKKEEADAAKDKLADAGVDSALVRVQK